MEVVEVILRFLETILVWPFAVLVLGAILLIKFRESISDFLQRLTEIKGGTSGVQLRASKPIERRREDAAFTIQTFNTPEELAEYINANPDEVTVDLFRELLNAYFQLRNDYWFENIFNDIYGSQMDVLLHLSEKGNDGDKYSNLRTFYNDYLKRWRSSGFDRPTPDYPVKDYIGHLENILLIEVEGKGNESIARITSLGDEFLSYIREQYPSTYSDKTLRYRNNAF